MTKNKYLRSIRNKLRFKFSQSTINSVVKDYDEYFEVGIANKQSIDEMILHLGTASDVVESLEEERDKFALAKYILRMILGLMFIYFSYFFVFTLTSDTVLVGLSSVFVITGAVGIWLIFGGDFQHSSVEEIKCVFKSKGLKNMVTATLAFYFFIILFIFWSAYYIAQHNRLPFSVPLKYARVYIFIIENAFVVMIPLIVTTFYLSRSHYLNTLPLLFIEFGMLFSIRVFFYLYSNSNLVISKMHLNFLIIAMIPIGVGCMISYSSYQLMKTRSKPNVVERSL